MEEYAHHIHQRYELTTFDPCCTVDPLPTLKSLICTPLDNVLNGDSPFGDACCCPTSANCLSTAFAILLLQRKGDEIIPKLQALCSAVRRLPILRLSTLIEQETKRMVM